MSHKDSQWDEAEMTDRSLKANLNKNENGLSLNGTLEIEINPPGQLSSGINFCRLDDCNQGEYERPLQRS
jgi:hypothetical protein